MSRHRIRHRVRHYGRRVKRFASKQRIPLETALALIGVPFMAPAPGWVSAYANFQQNQVEKIPNTLLKGFTGWAPGEPMNLAGIINPFDMSYAPFTKALILTGLISKIRKRVVHLPMGKIPFIGKVIS